MKLRLAIGGAVALAAACVAFSILGFDGSGDGSATSAPSASAVIQCLRAGGVEAHRLDADARLEVVAVNSMDGVGVVIINLPDSSLAGTAIRDIRAMARHVGEGRTIRIFTTNGGYTVIGAILGGSAARADPSISVVKFSRRCATQGATPRADRIRV